MVAAQRNDALFAVRQEMRVLPDPHRIVFLAVIGHLFRVVPLF